MGARATTDRPTGLSRPRSGPGDSLVPVHRSPQIRTERLLLRRWLPEDVEPFSEMNADPVVMEHFLDLMSRERTVAFVERIEAEFDEHGFGLWAVEVPGTAPFIGFVGLHGIPFEAGFLPAVEVGWRLAAPYWGRGYATEAARAAVEFGRSRPGVPEIVSFTSRDNRRSQRVMERLGMVRDAAGDFDHPRIPEGHRLQRHLLYRFPPR